MNGTVGAYYRRTYDMQPQLMLTPGLATVPSPAVCAGIGGQPLAPSSPTPCIINRYATNQADLLQKGRFGAYNLAFGEDIDIFGLSLSKNIAGVSVGAELSYRDNMPLISDPVVVLPAPLVPTTPGSISTENVPESGTPGATGETLHGVLNLLGLVGETALWDVRQLGDRTHVDAVAGRATERGGVQGPQRLRADRRSGQELLRPRGELHPDLVPGAAERRYARSCDLEPGHLRAILPSRRAARMALARSRSASRPTSARSIVST